MKRMDSLTNEEILLIAEDPKQVADLIDLECAHLGLPLLPPDPGPKPKAAEFAKDAPYYEVGSFMFASSESAVKVLELALAEGIYERDYRDGEHVLLPMKENSYKYPKIEKGSCYTPETYNQIKDEIAAAKKKVDAWEALRKDYDKALKERKVTSESFWNRVRFARNVIGDIADITARFNRYLELAGNNKEVALNFLMDGYRNQNALVVEDGVLYYIDENDKLHDTGITI